MSIQFSSSEIATYYGIRVPVLRQRRANRWRGKCPIHGGRNLNFSVNAQSGQWFCFSQCGRGGDIIKLEQALTGASWRDAVAEIEHIIGRPILDQLVRGADPRALAQRRVEDERDHRDAEAWRLATECLVELSLEDLPGNAPERYGPTRQLLQLRAANGGHLLALYHDYRAREPRLTAALAYAGERAWRRRSERLARLIMSRAAEGGKC